MSVTVSRTYHESSWSTFCCRSRSWVPESLVVGSDLYFTIYRLIVQMRKSSYYGIQYNVFSLLNKESVGNFHPGIIWKFHQTWFTWRCRNGLIWFICQRSISVTIFFFLFLLCFVLVCICFCFCFFIWLIICLFLFVCFVFILFVGLFLCLFVFYFFFFFPVLVGLFFVCFGKVN